MLNRLHGWSSFNALFPSQAVVKILQILAAISILIHFALAVKTIGIICGMLSFTIMLKHFQYWGGLKFFVASKTKILCRWIFFPKSRVDCIGLFTIFTITWCHFSPFHCFQCANLDLSLLCTILWIPTLDVVTKIKWPDFF